MKHEVKAGAYLSARRKKRAWRGAVSVLAAVVALSTVSALVLPAITLEAGTHCGMEEHTHSAGEGCYETRLVCGLEDGSAHTHDDSCYTEQRVCVCGLEESEGHTHDDACTQRTQICTEEHEHTDACFEITYTCGLAESEPHSHTDACYQTETTLTCTIPTEPHIHTESCYESALVCPLAEHKHTTACFSDPEADVETEDTWGRSASRAALTGDWAGDLVSVAVSQRGYAESAKNYRVETDEVTGEEVKKGYTRYGAWYNAKYNGDPYGDWSAMFLSFCLEYAGIPEENFPREAATETWRRKLSGDWEGYESCRFYTPAEGHTPAPGEIVFLDKNHNQLSDRAALVIDLIYEETTLTGIRTIGGDVPLPENPDAADAVGEEEWKLTDSVILGYAVLPENPAKAEDPELVSTVPETETLPPLTEEEQAQVNDIIARIDALPTLEELLEALEEEAANALPETAQEEQENTQPETAPQTETETQTETQTETETERIPSSASAIAGQAEEETEPADNSLENSNGEELSANIADDTDAYLTEVITQVSETYGAYSALTDAQRSAVTNADKLLSLVDGLGINGIMLLDGNSEPATQTGGFRGYVKDVSIEKVEDGTAPFDSDNSAGNDADNNNRIVRSFDTIKYELIATMGKRDTVSESQSEVLCFEIDMYKKISEATFDLSTMGWLQDGNATWEIQYIANVNGKEKAVMIQNQYGVLRYDSNEDGVIDSGDETTSFNALLSGSTDANSAYEMVGGSIVKQRLVGEKAYSNEGSAFAGRQTLTTGIQVRNAENGDTFEPSIRAYFKRNPENWGPLQDDGAGNLTSERESENEITLNNDYKNGAYKVTVSAAPLFNLMLEDTSEYVNLLSWFDFGAGQEVTDSKLLAYLTAAGSLVENWDKVNPDAYTNHAADENVASLYNALSDAQKGSLSNIRYGRMNGLGITLSLAASNTAGKGLMGCSLPVGDISFDLDLAVKTTVVDEGATPDTSGYSAILWDYRPNVRTDTYYYEDDGHIRQGFTNLDRGLSSRNMYWENIDFSREASHVAPRAYRGSGTFDAAVYDSGYWSLTGVNGGSGTNSSAGDVEDGHSTYTFRINDYDFDFDGFDSDGFPDRFYGEGAPNTRAGLRVTDYAFFGGYAQVLYVMPYAQSATVTIQKDVTVGNLTLTTKGDTSNLALAEGASQGGTVKTTNEADPYDNHTANALTLYSVGQFTSRSSFNTADATNHTMGDSGKSFLGTNFWSGPSWDENIFAGTDISIIGSAQLSTGSDNHVRAVNLLQLFDSKALSITPLGGITGSETADSCLLQSEVGFGNFYENTYGGHNPQVTYLFAADPAYTGGYDTNVDGIVAHMNLVRENNLVYSDKLYWNEEAGCYNIVKFDIDRDGNLEELTCVGVMAEVRNCNFKDYVYIRIPVTVADDESCVNTTVCTLNTATAWIDAGAMLDENGNNISWLNGQWANGTNTLAGYQTIQSAAQSGGNGYEKHNSNENAFVKVEYDDNGHYQTGVGGPAEGNTLLILGYKANVDVIDQKYRDDSSANFYSPGEGDDTVTWVVQGIETEISTDPTPQQGITTLTIPVTLAHTEGTATGTASELFPIENGTYTITVQNYQTDENGNAILNEAGELIPTDTSTYPISTDPDSPTEITFLGTYSEYNAQTGSYVTKKRLYTYKIYAVENSANDGVTFQLSDVPVGQKLPDITFQMFLSSVLGNSDKITATASISGAADKRAYSTTSGNMAQRTININNNTKTSLVKRVDKERGEMGTDIQYKVTFSNSGTTKIDTAYFYDNLPYDGDNRGTSYTSVDTDSTVMKAVELKSYKLGTTEDTGDFQADVTIYFSTLDDSELNKLLTGFNGTTSTTDPASINEVETMLANSAYFQTLIHSEPVYEANDAGTFYQLKPTVEGAAGTYTSTPPTAETLNNYVLKEGTDEAQRYLKHAFFRRTYAETQRWITRYEYTGGYLDEDKPVYATGAFNVTVGGKTVACNGGEEAYRTFLSSVTGIFVKMTNLGPSRDVVLTIDMATNTNKAGDVYANRAYNWNGAGVPIQTTIVSTKIYSRAISGLVWVDENLNGVYDEGETLLNGVTCTLFMWDDMQQKYVPCTTDVKGEAIAPIVTGSYNYQYHTIGGEASLTVRAWKDADNESLYRDEHGHVVTLTEDEMAASQSDGTYHFGGLSQGKYIVAFSGGDLEKYGGATSYQVMGGSTDANNDGVALTATANSNLDTEVSAIDGIDNSAYSYVIAFDLTSSGGTNQADGVTLKALSEISEETCMDSYDHQDLGLVDYAGFELPETGGGGGALYWTGGVLLMMAAALLLLYSYRKRGKEDIASS